MTIPNSDGVPVTSAGIRNVVDTFTRSTMPITGSFDKRSRGEFHLTQRKARWAPRLAAYLLRLAVEIDRLHRLLEEQGETIATLRSDTRTIEFFLDWCAKNGIRLCETDDDRRVLVPRGAVLESYRRDGGFGR